MNSICIKFASVIQYIMDQIVAFLDIVKDEKKMLLLLRFLLCLPISIITYKLCGGTFNFEDIGVKRMLLFFTTGEFMIPVVFLALAMIVSFKVIPFFLKLTTRKITHWTVAILLIGFRKVSVIVAKNELPLNDMKHEKAAINYFLKHLKIIVRKVFYKKIEIESGDFKEIEDTGKIMSVIIFQFLISYCYFHHNKINIPLWLNWCILIISIWYLLNFILATELVTVLNKYPNISKIVLRIKSKKIEPTTTN